MLLSSMTGSSRINPTEHLELAAQLLDRYIAHERSTLHEAQQDFRLSIAERSAGKIALLELALNLILDEVPVKPAKTPSLPPFITSNVRNDG